MADRFENLYDRIANEEDARVCKEISDDACNFLPKNFFLLIISNSLTKLGDALSSPKTVLAWLMSYVNAPLYLISFLVPIRESGSMLPQIFIAGYIRKLPVRKWIWVAGSFLQFASIAGIGVVSLFFKGATAGWLIILLLTVFSLARGLCSVASKDVLGKTIPKTRRGRLTGISAPFWGKMADTSSKHVMVRAALITSILGVVMFAIISWVAVLRDFTWLYPVAFFILGIAHSGVRLGRKTYIVDMAGGNKRTDYVAVSNTVIGVVLLITGGISALASAISPQGIILMLSSFGLIGAWVSYRLPGVQ